MAFWNRNRPETSSSDDQIRPPRATPRASGDAFGGVNSRTKKRQSMYLAGIAGVVLLAGSVYIFAGDDKSRVVDPTKPMKISTEDMVGRNLADKGWRAQAEVLQNDTNMRLKTVEAQSPRVAEMQKQISDLQQQNAAMKADGERVMQVYQQDNSAKAAQLAALQKGGAGGSSGGPGNEPFRVAGSGTPTYGPGGGYDQQGRPMMAGAQGAGGPAGMPMIAEVKTISFGASGAPGAGGTPSGGAGFKGESPDAPPTVLEDSIDYGAGQPQCRGRQRWWGWWRRWRPQHWRSSRVSRSRGFWDLWPDKADQ